MSIQVKFFAQLADLVGADTLQLENMEDTESLRKKVISDFPKLAGYPFVISVGKKISNGNQTIQPGDEVAFLPPFAGG